MIENLTRTISSKKFYRHFLDRKDRRKKLELDFVVHVDNSMCHNDRKISMELQFNKTEWAPHPAYFPDINPCDVWLLNFLKEKLQEQELSASDKIIEAITTIWNDVLLKSCRACSPNGFSE
jgi:hypothetical protein